MYNDEKESFFIIIEDNVKIIKFLNKNADN